MDIFLSVIGLILVCLRWDSAISTIIRLVCSGMMVYGIYLYNQDIRLALIMSGFATIGASYIIKRVTDEMEITDVVTYIVGALEIVLAFFV